MHIIKSSHSDRCNRLLRTTCNHRFRITTTNGLPCLADGIPAGSTGRDGCPVWTLCTSHDRHNAWGTIHNHHINKKWADAIWSLFVENLELVVQRHKAANTATDIDANLIGKIVSYL